MVSKPLDPHLAKLAKGSPNFGKLYAEHKLLALYGALAESTVFTDANGSLTKAGRFGEVLAEELIIRLGMRLDSTRQVDRVKALTKAGVLVDDVRRSFDRLRETRNEAAHADLFDTALALKAVKICYELGRWFYDAVTGKRTVAEFVPPAAPEETADADSAALGEIRALLGEYRDTLTEARTVLSASTDALTAERQARREAENLVTSATANHAEVLRRIDDLSSAVAALRKEQTRTYDQLRKQPRQRDVLARNSIVYRARQGAPLNEVQARREIDKLLDAAGWIIQDMKDLNPNAGVGVAVREFPLATGRADYVLYVGGSIVGVIEAKKEGTTLSEAVVQNDRYAAGVNKQYRQVTWRKSQPLAFRYATTGAETWFVNRLDPDARSREVFAFHKPETVAEWMTRADRDPEIPTYRAALRHLPELERGGFRRAQFDAIQGLEKSLAQDQPRSLIQMATGAGKTFMAVAESYRLLRFADAGRVLFLVDRNNLGKQALAEFKNYRTPDDGRDLKDLYGIDRLTGDSVLEHDSVVICTIQKMYSLLKGEPLDDDPDADDRSDDAEAAYERDAPVEIGYNPAVPIESFDLIVVDECHRSIYGLWRGVLEYFDAHVVGLTATPTLQTMGFFNQKLVSEYTYPQSVADGVNVDFDTFRIRTDLRERKVVKIDKNTVVPIRDRATRRKRYAQLDDDFTYTTKQIGRNVTTIDEIRTVLAWYRDQWRSMFGERAELPKTLVFAASDAHAEDILAQVKEVFARGDDFAKKITYKSRQAGEDPDQLINDFRNSPTLRVAVTVDMISTGTDIRALECMIFFRDVQSAVLLEQMKGRGARTIDRTELRSVTPEAGPDLSKDKFVIIDPIGVTDNPLADAQPLAAKSEKQVSLEQLLKKTGTKSITVDEAETLAGRLARLNQQIGHDERDELERAGNGVTLSQIVGAITKAVDTDAQDKARQSGGEKAAHRLVTDAIAPLTENPELRRRILEVRREKDYYIDEVNTSTITDVETTTAAERAEQELHTFRKFLSDHRDTIAAIQIALNCPGGTQPETAFAEMKELALTIRRTHARWTPEHLWLQYEHLGKASQRPGWTAGIPELITMIRYELGAEDELRTYREVVEQRFEGWLLRQRQTGVEFSDAQMWWLIQIKDVIANDIGVKPTDMNNQPFKGKGGGQAFARTFDGQERALKLLAELNQEIA